MAKQKKTEQPEVAPPAVEQAPIIAPVSISTTNAPQSQPIELVVPAGHVLLVALDAEGNEKAGTEFFYAEKSYRKFYGDETKFRVKKKLK